MDAENTFAATLLQPLLQEGTFLPWTTSSPDFIALAAQCNDIIINDRTSIVEFGSGISTIIIGRLLRRNGIEGTIVSFDENAGWAAKLNHIAAREGLSRYIKAVAAPLKVCELSLENTPWYDTAIVKQELAGKTIDMLTVDGPTAWRSDIRLSRYPALPFVAAQLAQRCSIFLDDAGRKGEKEIIDRWEKSLGLRFKNVLGSYAFCQRGENFNIDVLS